MRGCAGAVPGLAGAATWATPPALPRVPLAGGRGACQEHPFLVADIGAVHPSARSKPHAHTPRTRAPADELEVVADSIIIATGAVARRLPFPGSDEGPGGFWNKARGCCCVAAV